MLINIEQHRGGEQGRNVEVKKQATNGRGALGEKGRWGEKGEVCGGRKIRSTRESRNTSLLLHIVNKNLNIIILQTRFAGSA